MTEPSGGQTSSADGPPSEATRDGYARHLGRFDGTMVVVGGIVGAGIFLNPAVVARRASTPGLILGSWVLGGLVALVGALVFAELGVRRPRAGGGYVYLREAFGPLPAFLYGWTLLLVINTGAVAAVAETFARYTVDLFALPTAAVDPVALGGIAFLTGVNVLGIRFGSLTQNVFTVLKLLALVGLIGAGVALAGAGPSDAPPPGPAPAGARGAVAVVGAALVPVLFSYGGWQNANFVAEEMVDPRRDLPYALLVGVAVVVTVYVLANVAYLRALGPGGLAESLAPASDAMRRLLGPEGAAFIGAGVAISTFGILNLFILAAPRVYREMAEDGLFPGWASRLHPRYRTPDRALLLQGAWAGLLLLTGTYAELLDYVVFGDWIFFAAVAATLYVYRRGDRGGDERETASGVAVTGTAGPQEVSPPETRAATSRPETRASAFRPEIRASTPRPESPSREDPGFRMPGYPWLPALFVLAALYVLAGSVVSNPTNALVGAGIIGAGVPFYLYWRGRR